MMRVGIDVRLLSEPMTGIGRYTAELTRELLNKSGEFFLYSARPLTIKQWKQDNVKIRSANCHSRASRILWSETCLPYWATKDHVDLFWGPSHRLPRCLPSRVARVTTIHDLVWKHAGETMRPLSRFMEKMLMPQAVQQADRVVADSVSTAKAIEAEYIAASDKIRIVYPGVTDLPEAPDFQSSLFSLGVQQPYILFVGTREPRKNLKRLLEAYALLDTEFKRRAQLVIAGGSGWGNVDLAGWVKNLGLIDHVVLTGYVDDVQLSALYANSLFLAMPYLYEGFGLPIVEAMSYGKPVLTSNTSSMPEVAGEAAILVDPFDERAIASGLKSLLNNAMREKLASKAAANAARFNLQESAEKLWEVFREAIEIRKNTMQGSGE